MFLNYFFQGVFISYSERPKQKLLVIFISSGFIIETFPKLVCKIVLSVIQLRVYKHNVLCLTRIISREHVYSGAPLNLKRPIRGCAFLVESSGSCPCYIILPILMHFWPVNFVHILTSDLQSLKDHVPVNCDRKVNLKTPN